MLLSDRVAIVTGGAHGMGRSIAQKFADEGCSIAIADILADEANNTAAKISQKSGAAISIPCDITDSSQVQDMVEKAISNFGKVDILVNAAGLAGPSKAIEDYSKEEWDNILAVNLSGPFLCSKYVVPFMKNRKYGRIINFSSVAAIYAKAPRISYGAAKAGDYELAGSLRKGKKSSKPSLVWLETRQKPPACSKSPFSHDSVKFTLV